MKRGGRAALAAVNSPLRFDVILEMAKKGDGTVDEGERETPDHLAHTRTRR